MKRWLGPDRKIRCLSVLGKSSARGSRTAPAKAWAHCQEEEQRQEGILGEPAERSRITTSSGLVSFELFCHLLLILVLGAGEK